MMPMSDEIATVIANRRLRGGHYLLSLDSPHQAQATRPGQFAMVRLLGRSDVLLRRPMSVYDVKPLPSRRHGRAGSSESQSPEVIRLLYKVVGRGTRLMSDLARGDSVGLLAPLGHGFFREDYLEQARQADEVLHVAGGIGIAALLMAARELADAGIRQRLFFGGRTEDDLVCYRDFAPYVRSTALATEDGSRGRRGYVTVPLEAFLEKHRDKRFLLAVCGPWPMMRAAASLARKYGHQCLVSMENRMGCGLGVCLGCSIRVDGTGHEAYQRVCTEGPVFWAEHVVWEGQRPTVSD
jgi:dihydroorotate dehydrogenase electron transfer subunit